MQQSSTDLNGGEYPACGALTTGFVFRIENPATVYYLQQMGETGMLTTLSVSEIPETGRLLSTPWHNKPIATLAYGTAVLLAVVVIVFLAVYNDWWALGVVVMLVASRLCNVIVIRRRARQGWSGAPEPGKDGDLLVLLSQDRWVRIQGKVDHLKAVTSGQWLRDQGKYENWSTAIATLGVYLAAALVSNATQLGQGLILILLAGSVGLLALTNSATHTLKMHGYSLRLVMPRKKYDRRLDLANELIEETGRDDWAIRMGMVPGESGSGKVPVERVTM